MCGGRVILKLCHFERSSPVKRDLTVCHFERSGRSFSFVRAAPRPHPCHFERSGRSFSFVRAARTTGHAARNLSSAFCFCEVTARRRRRRSHRPRQSAPPSPRANSSPPPSFRAEWPVFLFRSRRATPPPLSFRAEWPVFLFRSRCANDRPRSEKSLFSLLIQQSSCSKSPPTFPPSRQSAPSSPRANAFPTLSFRAEWPVFLFRSRCANDRPRSEKSLLKPLAQVLPFRIQALDQRNLLRPAPAFDFLFAGNGGASRGVRLKPNKLRNVVFLRESRNQLRFVLSDAACQMAGHPDIKDPGLAGHDVHMKGAVHGAHCGSRDSARKERFFTSTPPSSRADPSPNLSFRAQWPVFILPFAPPRTPAPCHFERSGRSFSFVRAARTTGHAGRNLSLAFFFGEVAARSRGRRSHRHANRPRRHLQQRLPTICHFRVDRSRLGAI